MASGFVGFSLSITRLPPKKSTASNPLPADVLAFASGLPGTLLTEVAPLSFALSVSATVTVCLSSVRPPVPVLHGNRSTELKNPFH